MLVPVITNDKHLSSRYISVCGTYTQDVRLNLNVISNYIKDNCGVISSIYSMSGRVVSAYTNSSRRRELYI